VAHRHPCAYGALVLAGEYEERSCDGRWRLEAGDFVVHPRFHVHENLFARRGGVVVDVSIPEALAMRYSVYRLADPEALVTGNSSLVDALRDAPARAPQIPSPWLRAFMEALLAVNVRVDAAARAAGRSREHAARRFREWFGISPAGFVREQRLRRALAILRSDASLAQVATQAGYADQPHLTRSMRDALAMTPARLRREGRSRGR